MILILALLMIMPVLTGVNKALALSCTSDANCEGTQSPFCIGSVCSCQQKPTNCGGAATGTGIFTFLESGFCSSSGNDCHLDADSVCTLEGVCSSSDCPQDETCNLVSTGGGYTLSPCETIVITSHIKNTSATACCAIGGTLIVSTPGHCSTTQTKYCINVLDCPGGESCVGAVQHNVTPDGGIAEICGDIFAVNGKPVVFQLSDNVPVGSFRVEVKWEGYGETTNNTLCSPQGPSTNNFTAATADCPNPNADCTDVVCDPAKVVLLDLGGNRLGACSSASDCNDGGAAECCEDPTCADPVCNTAGSCSTAKNCNDGGAAECCPDTTCSDPTCSTDGSTCGTAKNCNDGGAAECCPDTTCSDPTCSTDGSTCGTAFDCTDGGAVECCPFEQCEEPTCSSDGSTCDTAFDCTNGGAATCCTAGVCELAVCNTDGSCSTIPDPACGNQGCTPGFWKANADKKQANAWPINPDTLLTTKFTIPSCVSSCRSKQGKILFTNLTLRQALSLQGGDNLCGKAEILLRTGTGSLVNALSDCVEFPISDAEVISKVNTALATCDGKALTDEAYLRDMDNNLGCPINQAGECSND